MVHILILSGADKDKANNHGQTPLYIAAVCGKRDVVEVLLANGADKKKAAKDGRTPWDVALDEDIRRMLQSE